MIETLVKYLNNQIGETNLFDKRFGLAEQVEVEGKTYPLIYLSSGNLKHVTEISDWLGMSYFRQDGNETVGTDAENYIACAIPLEITYPLKFVGTIKRDKLKKDDGYAADRVIQTLIKKIIDNASQIRSELNAKKVTFTVTSSTSDRKIIIEEEYPGVDEIQVNWEYIYISLDIEAKVFITKECLDDYCGDILVDENENVLIDQNNNELEAQ
jgi:hypothetical protein